MILNWRFAIGVETYLVYVLKLVQTNSYEENEQVYNELLEYIHEISMRLKGSLDVLLMKLHLIYPCVNLFNRLLKLWSHCQQLLQQTIAHIGAVICHFCVVDILIAIRVDCVARHDLRIVYYNSAEKVWDRCHNKKLNSVVVLAFQLSGLSARLVNN